LSDQQRIAENQRLQRELYGQTLHDRLRALMDVYGLSQRRLAEVLGVSAPMLSQLMSARRVKMGNPRAHERMVALEHRAAEHGVRLDPAGPASSPRAVLPAGAAAEITGQIAAQDVSETTNLRARHAADTSPLSVEDLVQGLRARVGAGELRSAHQALSRSGGAETLRALLARALE